MVILSIMKRQNQKLEVGTKVICTNDGEPGRIVRVSTFRRNGINAWSYVVNTAYGNEIWEAGEIFVIV